MNVQMKEMFEKANVAYTAGKAIMKEFDGKEMPADKKTQLDKYFDEAERFSKEAEGLKRADDLDKKLNSPEYKHAMGAEGGDPEGGKEKKDKNAEEKKAVWNKFLKYGAQGLERSEIKDLAADEDVAGGYLVFDTQRVELLQKQKETMAMRMISRVLPAIPGGSSITPAQDSELDDATWTSEIKTGSTDTVKPFAERILTPHPLAKRIKISNTLLRAAAIDLSGWVNTELAYKFNKAEEDGFVNGGGAQRPLGQLNTPSLPTKTTDDSNVVSADDIINWIFLLPASYAANQKIICNRAFIRKIRALKHGDGTYIWQPGLSIAAPANILGVPYVLSDRYDDGLDGSDVFEDNAVVAVTGDFNYYWIVDSMDISIQVLKELYAESNQTGYIGRKETDGMAVLAEAFMD